MLNYKVRELWAQMYSVESTQPHLQGLLIGCPPFPLSAEVICEWPLTAQNSCDPSFIGEVVMH